MFSLITALALIPDAAAWTSTQAWFNQTISTVEQMVWSPPAQQLVARHGLSLVNVTWEDTGRYKGSSVGPNISDMTIGVRDPSGNLHPMPVIRYDNYSDLTGDIDAGNFWLRVGNERGRALRTVSLADVLQDTRSFLHDRGSWAGWRSSLWSDRDDAVIVSAQACFLPIPREGAATFTPVLYNYQSYPGNPAVLTMVATREGTSVQVVENEGGYLSEVLYFNENGRRAPFVAERLSDWKAHGGDATSGARGAGPDSGLDVVLVVQVPLKQREVARYAMPMDGYFEAEEQAAAPMASMRAKDSDVEVAVVGHGQTEGPYSEINGLNIERDPRFPVRVTVQFYKATSNGVVSDADVADIKRQIDRVYANADAVGSLVTQGYTGRQTEWVQSPPPPPPTDTARWSSPSWSWLKPW